MGLPSFLQECCRVFTNPIQPKKNISVSSKKRVHVLIEGKLRELLQKQIACRLGSLQEIAAKAF